MRTTRAFIIGVANTAILLWAPWIGGPATATHVPTPFRADPLVGSPAVARSVAAGLQNPAAWPMQRGGGLYLSYDDAPGKNGSVVTGVLSLQYLAFGVERMAVGFGESPAGQAPTRYAYTLGAGWGSAGASGGLAYRWTRGDSAGRPKDERLVFGSIHRWRALSLGLARSWQLESGPHSVQGDVGLRPWGPRWTLFADAWNSDDRPFDDLDYGLGLAIDVIPGLNLGSRYSRPGQTGKGAWSLRASVSLQPGTETSYRHHWTPDQDRSASTVAVEFHRTPALSQILHPEGNFAEIDLRGALAYRTYRFLDSRPRMVPLLQRIDQLATDRTLDGVVIRLSSFRAPPALLWELRAQLAGLRASGKQVIIYLDRVTLFGYMLATVADQIWIDPLGHLDLRGLNLGRSYYRTMLDKLGVGIDEWRFFTYKTASETYSRTSMSDADREQITALADDLYGEAVNLIGEARGIDLQAWNRLVDESGMILPEEAVALGLADSVGTYAQATLQADRAPRRSSPDVHATSLGAVLGDPIFAGEEWGERPRIALFYAIGECAMDSGIRGRSLARAVQQAGEDPRVKAIVLRVDSPGGDPLPSDLVARELKEAAGRKPVIVSQGQLAASGGYWLSMHADSILASPLTITGSIGVIAAHVWDDGIGQKIGLDYESIKRGSGADLEAGPVLPLLGISIPKRPATTEERARAEEIIRELYRQFVAEVATGREMQEDEVGELAQGRVWSGSAARSNGLVDRVGSLWDALRIARAAAGLNPDRPIEIVEGPGLGWINPEGLLPFPLFGLRGLVDRATQWTTARGGEAPADQRGVGDSQSSTSASGPDLGLQVHAIDRLFASSSPLASLPADEQSYLRQLLRLNDRPMVLMPPLSLEGLELAPPIDEE